VRVAIVLACLGLIAFGLTDTLLGQVQLHHAQVRLTATHSAELATANRISVAEKTIQQLATNETIGNGDIVQLNDELAAAQAKLTSAEQGLNVANFSVTTVDNCLNGVYGALSDLAAGNQAGAVTALQNADGSCLLVDGATAGGPVYPYDFPDPDVINVAGTYYAYGTNSADGNIQVLESTNLTSWTVIGNALPSVPSWALSGDTWAPGVIQLGGRFLLYYAVATTTTECISVAVATQPQGPFNDDTAGPIVCQPDLGGSIDPSPYVSGSGQLYLTWKSNGADGQAATIWAQPVAPGGTAMASGSSAVAILVPTQFWEGEVVEGPDMWDDGGTYFLFYSGNDWETADYAEGVAKCSGPLGPCTKPLPGPILGSTAQFSGPGGGSVFTTAQGQPFIAFHGWQPAAVGPPNPRLLFIRPIVFENGYPVVGASD
jgi:beta-xylosidase